MSVNQAIKHIVETYPLANKHKTTLILGSVLSILPKKVNAIVYTDYKDEPYLHIQHDRYSMITVDMVEETIRFYLITPYQHCDTRVYWEGIGLYNNTKIEQDIKRAITKGVMSR